jgi:hypothetical protein
MFLPPDFQNRDCVVARVMRQRAEWSGVRESHFWPLKRQDVLGVPPSLPFRGFRPGREVDYQPLSVAEVKNVWSYASAALYVFTACTETNFNLPLTSQCSGKRWWKCTRDVQHTNLSLHILSFLHPLISHSGEVTNGFSVTRFTSCGWVPWPQRSPLLHVSNLS